MKKTTVKKRKPARKTPPQPMNVVTGDGGEPDADMMTRLVGEINTDNETQVKATLTNTVCRLARMTPGEDDQVRLNQAMGLMLAVKPANDLELTLATQMGAIHDLALHAAVKAKQARHLDHYQSYSNQVVRLSRVFMEQLTALQKLRGQGQQKIIVEKVHVASGGQAAIGVNGGQGT